MIDCTIWAPKYELSRIFWSYHNYIGKDFSMWGIPAGKIKIAQQLSSFNNNRK